MHLRAFEIQTSFSVCDVSIHKKLQLAFDKLTLYSHVIHRIWQFSGPKIVKTAITERYQYTF